MAIEVKIPQISEDVETAEVMEILVSQGDRIEKEQSIITLETDKASVEVPSSHSGKVQEIKVKEGDEVKVGDVILTLEEGDESDDEGGDKEEKKDKSGDEEADDKAKKGTAEGSKKAADKPKEEAAEDKDKPKESASKENREEDDKASAEPEKEASSGKEGQKETADIPASPAVRRLARETGVAISELKGSGPGGRITPEDVKSQSKKAGSGKTTGTEALPDFSRWGTVETEPLSNIRKATAKNLSGSWQAIPHVTQFDEADISRVEEYMEVKSEKIEKAGGKLTITAILVKVLATAMQQFPKFNSSIDLEKEEVILKKYFHIGIAVDTEKGLLVPVIRDVNHMNIGDLAVEITRLAEKAKDGDLSLEDMQGGNMTLSNLGGIGGTQFTPIIYHPQVAILGVSKAKIQPVYKRGKFEPRKILPLSLSYDHRLIDGAEGAQFLRWICLALEDPFEALFGF
jgi:pyruvate dehydrogenase E2 component (dihydrolipoamide acetyltransferase)